MAVAITRCARPETEATPRPESLGVTNVERRVLDVEDIAEPDASFDVVVCREGLMFAVDPARGTSEIQRVLRSGGRVAIAVRGPRAANPWVSIVFDEVGAQLGIEIPPPGIPGPVRARRRDEAARPPARGRDR